MCRIYRIRGCRGASAHASSQGYDLSTAVVQSGRYGLHLTRQDLDAHQQLTLVAVQADRRPATRAGRMAGAQGRDQTTEPASTRSGVAGQALPAALAAICSTGLLHSLAV